MPKSVRELVVFLASPGDLETERAAVREVERRLNSIFENRQARVRVVGWENVPPALGRPQELINPLVHECDLFVGLMGRRWGSKTGEFSSGFEEEFNIAMRRRDVGDVPAIGIFFAEIPIEAMADPGPQLEKVIEFRNKVKAERMALFKTFRNVDHLAIEVQDFLTLQMLPLVELEFQESIARSGVLEIAGGTPTKGQMPSLESGEELATTDSETASLEIAARREPDEAQVQIASALRAYTSWFEQAASSPPDVCDRDRVALVGSAFANEPVLLGAHLVNRLYKQREQVALTVGEANLWYRTYFSDFGYQDRDTRTIPIWGALKAGSYDAAFDQVLTTLLLGDDERAARGSLRYITEKRIRLRSLWVARSATAEVIGDADRDGDLLVTNWQSILSRFDGLSSGLNYIASVAIDGDGITLELVAAKAELSEAMRTALLAYVAARRGDAASAAALAPSRYASATDVGYLIELVMGAIPACTADVWRALVVGSHSRIATAAAVQLALRDKFTRDELKAVLALDSVDVTMSMVTRAKDDPSWGMELMLLLREVDKYNQESLIARLLASVLTREQLMTFDDTGYMTMMLWEARAIKNPELEAEAARAILDGTSQHVSERVEPLLGQYQILATNLVDHAKRAACTVLAGLNSVDLADARRVLEEFQRDSYITRGPAISALSKICSRLLAPTGMESCLKDLGWFAETAQLRESLSSLDAYWAIDLSEQLLASPIGPIVAGVWRESEIPALRVAALEWELTRESTPDDDLEFALYDDEAKLRMSALDVLLSRWDENRITALLNRYDDRGRAYWYNVIVGLDEYLSGYKPGLTQPHYLPAPAH
ncbi:DUF4062 domain-containing protein [Planctomonas deserti]|uniref:DUF4062 domain-containing protein n=1 Tax=Planctomonas deserti TaxID=2144185 RepID=UPI000D37AC3B|nr:DUF4062 domain-containing protein [Planctomonas deserti]